MNVCICVVKVDGYASNMQFYISANQYFGIL